MSRELERALRRQSRRSGEQQITSRHHSVRYGKIATVHGEVGYDDWLRVQAERLAARGRWTGLNIKRGANGKPELFGYEQEES